MVRSSHNKLLAKLFRLISVEAGMFSQLKLHEGNEEPPIQHMNRY